MDQKLAKEHVALKMRVAGFSAKADAVLAVAAMLNEATVLNQTLLQHAGQLADEVERLTLLYEQAIKPVSAPIRESPRATPREDCRPPGGDGGVGDAPVIRTALERDSSGVRGREA